MIYNGELRYEHYLKNSNYHLGVFYKQINNPVVAKSNGSNSYTFVNMERALVYGSEFEFNQTFKFRKGHFIDNIQLIGNLSFNFSSLFEKVKGTDGADSIRKLTKSMVGQSPYIANIQLSAYFRKKKGHVTLNGFYQGNRVLFAGDEEFFFSLIQRTGVQLSFTSSYELSGSTSLRFKVDNILNVSDLLYNDFNRNNKLDYYKGYITDINGDNIFSQRRDPAVVSISLLTKF